MPLVLGDHKVVTQFRIRIDMLGLHESESIICDLIEEWNKFIFFDEFIFFSNEGQQIIPMLAEELPGDFNDVVAVAAEVDDGNDSENEDVEEEEESENDDMVTTIIKEQGMV